MQVVEIVFVYAPQKNWELVKKISWQTKRCKTDLVREAVKEYLRESS
jgi:hypothetical protein